MKNQLDAAREGIITEEMERVARDEGVDREALRDAIAAEKRPYSRTRGIKTSSPRAWERA